MNTLNTRVLFLAGLLLSGCTAMPSPEQIQAQREQLERDRARWAEEERRQHEADREEKEKLKQYQSIVDSLSLAVRNREIRLSDAHAFLVYKAEEMFGPLDPASKEKELHHIMVFERLEAECVNNFETPVAGSLVSNAALRRGVRRGFWKVALRDNLWGGCQPVRA